MYTITFKVKIDGTLVPPSPEPVRIATKGDKQNTYLHFVLDNGIEHTCWYVKYWHQKRTVLQRVYVTDVCVPINVTSLSGRWLISFISTDKPITPTSTLANHIFQTVPIEVEVADGLLDIDIDAENTRKIAELEDRIIAMEQYENSLISMSSGSLTIPSYVNEVGDYFLYNASQNIYTLTIGSGVKKIGSYAFYGMEISVIVFDDESELTELRDYAFSHVNTREVMFPPSLREYGHYAFQGGTIDSLNFAIGSEVYTINANAFNGVSIRSLYLPEALRKLATNGYVFRNCHIDTLHIPSTLNTAIAKTTFYEGTDIKNIELESNFNVSANFSNLSLEKDVIVSMMRALKNRSGMDALSFTIGSSNLAKLTDADIQVATNKNWTVS